MSGISTVKPSLIETVGGQYICFNTVSENGDWTNVFSADVTKLETVKTVTVKDNANAYESYASGKVYVSDTEIPSSEIEVENIAFSEEILGKMRADLQDEGGLCLSGGARKRPYFAYGKVVKLKNNGYKWEWYPKCQLTENSDKANTSEDKFKEQTSTIKIKAFPFNDAGDVKAYVSSEVNPPTGLTEEMFFAKPILTKADLTAANTSGSTAE